MRWKIMMELMIVFMKVHLVYILASKISVVDHISVEYRFFLYDFLKICCVAWALQLCMRALHSESLGFKYEGKV